jgi:hypothetical protein
MKTRNLWLLSALALLGACGGSDHHGSPMGGTTTPPPPTPIDDSIQTFVKQSFADSSDSAEPVDINDRSFTDDEDETAYDALL